MPNERLRELSEKTDEITNIQADILFLKTNHSTTLADRLTVAEHLISKLVIKVNHLSEAATATAKATAATAAVATAAALATAEATAAAANATTMVAAAAATAAATAIAAAEAATEAIIISQPATTID